MKSSGHRKSDPWGPAELLDAAHIIPGKNKRANYGSVYPLCASSLLVQLNKQRTEQLKKWLDGTEEGDVCAGSVKLTSQLE